VDAGGGLATGGDGGGRIAMGGRGTADEAVWGGRVARIAAGFAPNGLGASLGANVCTHGRGRADGKPGFDG
jgi:hypothetical protein